MCAMCGDLPHVALPLRGRKLQKKPSQPACLLSSTKRRRNPLPYSFPSPQLPSSTLLFCPVSSLPPLQNLHLHPPSPVLPPQPSSLCMLSVAVMSSSTSTFQREVIPLPSLQHLDPPVSQTLPSFKQTELPDPHLEGYSCLQTTGASIPKHVCTCPAGRRSLSSLHLPPQSMTIRTGTTAAAHNAIMYGSNICLPNPYGLRSDTHRD